MKVSIDAIIIDDLDYCYQKLFVYNNIDDTLMAINMMISIINSDGHTLSEIVRINEFRL